MESKCKQEKQNWNRKSHHKPVQSNSVSYLDVPKLGVTTSDTKAVYSEYMHTTHGARPSLITNNKKGPTKNKQKPYAHVLTLLFSRWYG